MMEIFEALMIVGTLRYGHTPGTNESLATDSIWRRDDVKKSLQIACEHLQVALRRKERTERRRNRQRSLPANAGSTWDKSEDMQLVLEFEKRVAVPEIARIHARTEWAIFKRLEHLGRIKLDPPALRRAA